MTAENSPNDRTLYQIPDDDSPAEILNRAIDEERDKLGDAITHLGRLAISTITDTYTTEDMGVVFAPGFHEQIIAERERLNQNHGEMVRLQKEMNLTISEVQRGIGSLQFLIDPENN